MNLDTFQNRFEIKYVIPGTLANSIVKDLAPFCIPDPNSVDQKGFYDIYSLYYDSPNLAWYFEKIDGKKKRKKLRVRYYGSIDVKKAFIEIKRKDILTVSKERIEIDAKDINRRIFNPTTAEIDGSLTQQKIYSYSKFYQLQPKVLIKYTRQAFIGRSDPRLRITFDTNLKCSKMYPNSDMIEPTKKMISPLNTILEIKFNTAHPKWLRSICEKYSLNPTRVSKYCLAIDKTYPKTLIYY
ncbi:MAG: polyphosphate polymerase domain-containing protein [Bacteriovoracaceae bacterium]|jgi:hypothetical protein|nr:polyphosphate polymerase domain-containing protein [Bacteriovoracaceae bacterium]